MQRTPKGHYHKDIRHAQEQTQVSSANKLHAHRECALIIYVD